MGATEAKDANSSREMDLPERDFGAVFLGFDPCLFFFTDFPFLLVNSAADKHLFDAPSFSLTHIPGNKQ